MSEQDAAPSSTQPEVVTPGELSSTDTVSSTPSTETPVDTSVTDTTVATADVSDSSSTDSTASAGTEDPNGDVLPVVSPIADALALSVAPALPSADTGVVSGFVGDIGNAIRTHLADIKAHLSLQGFEQATVKFIHDKIAAIERWL